MDLWLLVKKIPKLWTAAYIDRIDEQCYSNNTKISDWFLTHPHIHVGRPWPCPPSPQVPFGTLRVTVAKGKGDAPNCACSLHPEVTCVSSIHAALATASQQGGDL